MFRFSSRCVEKPMTDSDNTIFSECFNIFMHFGKSRNLSQTATEFGISLSSASRRIHRLESTLETDLIVPGKRPFTLTSAGLRLFGAMTLESSKVEEILQEIRGTGRVAKTLRIGFIESFAQASASIINNCAPSLDTILNVTGTTDRLKTLFNTGEIDAVVTAELPCNLSEVRSFCFLREPSVVVLPKKAARNLPDKPTWKNLSFCGFPFISTYRKDRTARALENFLASNNIHFLSRLEVDNIGTKLSLIADGLGWSLIPVTSLYQHRLLLREYGIEKISVLQSPNPVNQRRLMLAVGGAVSQSLFSKLSEELSEFTEDTILPWALNNFPWLKGKLSIYRLGE